MLPQITHLDIEFWGDRDEGSQPAPWHAIFCQASTTHTLTHLVMHETLTDELVWVLVQHAPALSHLTVLNLLVKADHSGREWGVRELVVTEKRFECEAVHLARLPVSVGVGVGAGAGVGEAMTVRLEGLLFQVVFDQVSWRAHTHTHIHTHTHVCTQMLTPRAHGRDTQGKSTPERKMIDDV